MAQDPPDVIISDMRMPEMSGAAFLTKAREGWSDCVRLLLTGFSDAESTIAAVNEGGIHAYLNKPWDDTQLLQTVRAAVERKHLVDERNALLVLTARQAIRKLPGVGQQKTQGEFPCKLVCILKPDRIAPGKYGGAWQTGCRSGSQDGQPTGLA